MDHPRRRWGDNPDIFRFVALGYVSATWESWTGEIGERRLGLFENMRRRPDRDYAERGIPEELYYLVYGTNVMSVQIPDFARPGDDSLTDRLDLIWEQVVLANTESRVPRQRRHCSAYAPSTTAASGLPLPTLVADAGRARHSVRGTLE